MHPSPDPAKKSVLCVGWVGVDIVNVLASFPEEDSKGRLLEAYVQVGGCATNNSTALSILGAPCQFFGILGSDMYMSLVEKHFKTYGVGHGSCIVLNNTPTPISTVLINSQTGSRTILHYHGTMREITFQDFKDRICLANHSWVHFEGPRQPAETLNVIEYIHQYNKEQDSEETKIRVSVELERAREETSVLLEAKADYFFMSREFCEFNGQKSKEQAVEHFLQPMHEGATVVVPWGTDGAAAKTKGIRLGQKQCDEAAKDIVKSEIFPPEKVVDTLGAGDCFVAATLNSLYRGLSVLESITEGCKVAGRKVGIRGITQEIRGTKY